MNLVRLLGCICFLFFVCGQSFAQETQLKKPELVQDQTVGPNESKIIVLSNSESLSMTHSVGDEVAVKKELSKGVFEYSILYTFPEDYDDDFMKTQLVLRMDAGQETLPLVMYKGKVYSGSFFEVLKLQIKKDNDAVYPYEKSAKVSFTSALDNLSVSCNGQPLFNEGKASSLTDSNVKLSVSQNGSQTEYSMAFSLDDAVVPAINLRKNLVFQVVAPGFKKATTNIEVLNSRTSYNYMVVGNVKIIEKEVTYEELLDIAKGYSQSYTSQNKSAYFAAAADAYEAVRAHKDCPLDLKDTYQLKANDFKRIRNLTNFIEQAEAKWRASEASEGFESAKVWKYLNFERKQCETLLTQYPTLTYFKKLKEEVDGKYMKHPLSKVSYPVIQGKVTKGEGWFLPVEGTRIYALYRYADSLKDIKDMKPVGHVQNGQYKIILREACRYLYFAGEKRSHAIEYKSQNLDIELTR